MERLGLYSSLKNLYRMMTSTMTNDANNKAVLAGNSADAIKNAYNRQKYDS